jgi:hypothetical protein
MPGEGLAALAEPLACVLATFGGEGPSTSMSTPEATWLPPGPTAAHAAESKWEREEVSIVPGQNGFNVRAHCREAYAAS